MQTDGILSCPPDSCMLFNCPGHEVRVKGLSGCGIDTVSAPVDTLLVLNFVSPDSHTPSAVTRVSRMIVVVSPCGPEHIYCADLADPQQPPGSGHACGTTNCAFRAAILALQLPEPVPPSLSFSSAVPLTSLSEAQDSPSPTPIHGHEQQNFSQVVCCCLLRLWRSSLWCLPYVCAFNWC